MSDADQDQVIVSALEGAIHQVKAGGETGHHRAAAGAVPPWLASVLNAALKAVGPALADALINFLQQFKARGDQANDFDTNA